MKKTILVLAAVGALALTACSSDETSDATPGGNGDGPTPQVTDDGPPAGGGSFCEMIADSETLSDDLNEAEDALDDLMEDSANWDSPETIAALHNLGQEMIEYADDIAFILNRAAAEANDPEVSEAFTNMANYFQTFFTGMGQAAAEADSMMGYLMGMGQYLDEDTMNQMMEDLSESGPIISDYIFDTCGASGFDF